MLLIENKTHLRYYNQTLKYHILLLKFLNYLVIPKMLWPRIINYNNIYTLLMSITQYIIFKLYLKYVLPICNTLSLLRF